MLHRHIYSCVDFLNDSTIVSRVQQYFGIESLHNDDDSNNNKNKYRIKNRFFFVFFSFVTQLGSEIFYIIFLPLMAWLFNERQTYLTCLSWALNMYIGQMTKEVFRMPRPITPPVVKLDKQYIDEYGFPSTHAMAAMSISFSFLTLLFNNNNNIEPQTDGHYFKSTVILIAICMCVLIGLSRIYLGMHSLLDVLGGLIYSYVISSLFVPHLLGIDSLLRSSIVYGLAMYALGVCMCLAYPKSNRQSSARVDTFIIIGVASGICMATSLKSLFSVELVEFGPKLMDFSQFNFFLVLLRVVVGGLATFLTRLTCKKLIFYVALNVFNYSKYFHPNEQITVKMLVEKKYSFEFLLYFLTYSSVSFTVFFTSFVLFNFFKI